MEEIKNNNYVKIKSELKSLDGTFKDISIVTGEDGTPLAVAFFDIDKTLAELKSIHGKAIIMLLEEFLNGNIKETKVIEDVEKIYFDGFKLGNSFREFDRMNGIFELKHYDWIDPNVYIKERLNLKMKEIDSEGTEEHKITKMYLDKYVDIASKIAEDIYKNNPEEYNSSKIRPVFALAKFYKALGIPMFGMTANGRKFVETVAKYLDLPDLFIDIATDEDMVGGGKEIIIPKLIKKLEDKGIKVSKEKLVVVGDSLSGDIGSGFRYKGDGKEIAVKGILVLKDNEELEKIKNQISENEELKRIVENTDVDAFIVDNVKIDRKGVPQIFSDKNNFLIKL
jgi:phosphoglycolate phosphatase-like HAD superfamily hydrolase